MADVSHDALVLAFQKRYDFQAARSQLKAGLKALKLDEKKEYTEAECQRIVGALADDGEREVQTILDALAPPAPAEDKKADKGADKKDDKKAAKKDDKKDDKKAAKGKKK